MRYHYYLCDIFTDVRFGGNQLAILPHAEGLRDEQMQQIEVLYQEYERLVLEYQQMTQQGR